MDNKQHINELYKYKRENIIIGLTGRTGSGCSTVAEFLCLKEFSDFCIEPFVANMEDGEEKRKMKTIIDFLKNRWEGFYIIEVSSIILSFVLEKGIDDFIDYIRNLEKNNSVKIGNIEGVKSAIEGLKKYFRDAQKYKISKDVIQSLTDGEKIEYLNYYLKAIHNFKQSLKKKLDNITCNLSQRHETGIETTKLNLYSYLLQTIGNNLRNTGDCYEGKGDTPFSCILMERIDDIVFLISQICRYHYICIDALRNPMEIMYFKDRYRYYYTVSINATEEDRKARLTELTEDELKNLDRVEYPHKHKSDEYIFFHQDIQKCIELADIHINNKQSNNGKKFFLILQLIKYIALMIHPGLITPSKEEYCMQIAFNAKFNSGCLSRQVGAVITNKEYSVKAVGWNNTPSKQLPCNLRTVQEYCDQKDKNCFSQYELNSKEFEKAMMQINLRLKDVETAGLPYCFCFKDIINAIDKNKNQVYTRSLHAEENAFLQIAKYGGNGIQGGKLFVTASPCELCSKKSYQLGIRDIFYIDPYPGIARDHILKFGETHNPQVHLFSGAVGNAYVELYSQRMSIKDELSFVTGLNNKQIISEIYHPQIKELSYSDMFYKQIEIEFEFLSRTEMRCSTRYEMVPLITGIKEMEFLSYWTGDNVDDVKCLQGYDLYKRDTGNATMHKYSIDFGSELEKDKLIEYKIEMMLKDLDMVMIPHLIHKIKNKTEKLVISILNNDNDELFNETNIYKVVYADMDLKQLIEKEAIEKISENGKNKYQINILGPLLNYGYGISWEFKKI